MKYGMRREVRSVMMDWGPGEICKEVVKLLVPIFSTCLEDGSISGIHSLRQEFYLWLRYRLTPSSIFIIIERDLIGVTTTRSLVLDEVFQGLHLEVRGKHLQVSEVFQLSVAVRLKSIPNPPTLREYGMNCHCDQVPRSKGRVLRLNFKLIKRKENERKKLEDPEKDPGAIIPAGIHYVGFWPQKKGRSAAKYIVKSLGG